MSAPRSKATKAARKPKPIDFDTIRKQKAVALGDIPPVKIAGKTFVLPDTLPLAVTERFAESSTEDEEGNVTAKLRDMIEILSELFGPDQWAEIRRHIDYADVPLLFTSVFDAYGESVGEAENSGES